MNLTLLSLLLILIPLSVQLFLGINRKTKTHYSVLTFFNIVFAFAMVYAGFEIIWYDLSQQQMKCGLPLSGFAVLGFAALCGLAAIIIIQIIVRMVNARNKI